MTKHKQSCEWPECPGGEDCEGLSLLSEKSMVLTADECWCEETATDGEYTCPPCKARQATEPTEAERETNRLLHHITGGDFL